MLLSNQLIIEEIKQKFKKNTLKQIKTKTQQSKIYGMQQQEF